MNEIKIYITDLAAYNNGKLIWERVNLGEVEKEELQKIVKKYNEEIFISDFEWPVKVWEYDNPFELLEVQEELNYLDNIDILKFKILSESYKLEEALEKIDNVIIYPKMDYKDLAYQQVEEWFYWEIPESIINYIDYNSIWIDLSHSYAEYNIDWERWIFLIN